MRQFRSILVFCLFALCWGSAFAQAYPTHAIKLIHPFAPGAANDGAVRLVADRLSLALKQPVIVESKPGAGSLVGTDFVAKSAPDGYTLIVSFSPAIAPGPLMVSKMPYDPLKDFVHIAMIGVFPQYVIVRSDSPAKTLQEFVALAKAKPGAINYASAGVGSAGFFAAELLKQQTGIDMVHVPYKGASPAVMDLLGGRLDMVLTASAAELVRSGKVRMLAVSNDKRVAAYPDVPTMSEVYPGVQGVSWLGISAPAKTPRAIVSRLEKEIVAIVSAPDLQARFADPSISMIAMPLGSAKFLEFINNENRIWGPIIKAGNIKID